MGQAIPVYVINLDRRPDRRAFMAGQLAGMALDWTRIPALDAATAPEDLIAGEVAACGHLIPMGRGSRCNACNHFAIMRRLVAGDAPAALVLEDDIELSPDLPAFLRSAGWLPPRTGLVRFEKWSRRRTSKLLGPPLATSPVPGRSIRRLHSRIGGSGCYIVTRAAAARILEGKGVLRHPIDHLLFNLNLSPLAREVGVAMVVPALARQALDRFASDIAPARRVQTKSLAGRLRRGLSEVALLPRQLAAVAVEGARLVPVASAERTR
jgi:glycosyl transferase, family 25